MNQTTITAVGTLITPLKPRRLTSGASVVTFRMACNERRVDRVSGVWVDGDTFYVSVTCWRRLADNVVASLVKGDPIVVRGRIFTREYERDGRRHFVTEIDADMVGTDLTRSTAVVSRNRRADDATTVAGGAVAEPSSGQGHPGDVVPDVDQEQDRYDPSEHGPGADRRELVPAAGH